MRATTSFAEWLGDEGPADEGEQDDLLQALRETAAVSRFRVDLDGPGTTRVSGIRTPLTLLLTTKKAAFAFLKAIEGLDLVPPDDEDEDDPDVGHRRAMDNPHA